MGSQRVGHKLGTQQQQCSLQQKIEKFYTVSENRCGADCGSVHELLNANFRLNLKKLRKSTKSFRYDLNEIPYD